MWSADDAAGPQQTFMQKIKMLTLLERQLGERQIDIVVEQAQDMRPIVAVAYKIGVVYIKFIGTHKEYDAVDAETVEM